MVSVKPTKLIEYCKANYADVRIIGVVNPSIIIHFKGKNYIVYREPNNKKGRYTSACGEDRNYFNDFSELKRIIK